MDTREFGNRVFWIVVVLCALSVGADFFYHKHGIFKMEDWIGFHGFYGFVSCVALVIAAKGMRRIVKRDEDYYD